MTVQILITAAMAIPVLFFLSIIEGVATDGTLFATLMSVAFFIVIVCLGILGFNILVVMWS